MSQRAGRWATTAAVAALAACLAFASDSESGSKDRVVIGVRGGVDSLNIYTASTILAQEVSNLLFPLLAVERADFASGPPTFEPSLARRWEFSQDGLSLVFHLDPDARWSDGRPITSKDVVFSHQAATSPEVGWVGRDVKELIESVSAEGDHAVRFRFRQRYPYQVMDAVEGNILPSHHYGAIPFSAWPKTEFTSAPVVFGPYRLASNHPGESLILERAGRGAPGGIRRLVFRVLPDVATLLAELESGGIDVMENVPAAQAGRLGKVPSLELITVPDLSYTFVCWNLRSPLFSDPRVRRALTMAIDRQAILDGVLFGKGRLLGGPILSMFWAHDAAVSPWPHDAGRARALLAEAGWADTDGDGVLDKDGRPFRFVLESNQGSQIRNDTAVMIQDHLKRVGIDAQPRILEWRAFLQKHEAHDFEAFVGGQREPTKVDLKSLLHSSAIDGGYNHGGYASPAMDAAIDKARREIDSAQARRLWSEAQQIFHQDQPFTVLFEMQRINAVSRRITGVSMTSRSAFANLPSWRLRETTSRAASGH